MSGETTFAKIKFAEAVDEVNKFPVNVSEPGAKTIDKYLEEHTLTIKKRAAGYTATSGEWGIQEKAAETTTLPAATANVIVGVFCKTTSCKITTSGGAFIQGSAVLNISTEAAKVATVTLTEGMHLLLIADGTNWEIISGEIKQEQKYSVISFTKAEASAGVEPSATRPALVNIEITEETTVVIFVGGKLAGSAIKKADTTTVFVPPGQKWEVTSAVNAYTMLL